MKARQKSCDARSMGVCGPSYQSLQSDFFVATGWLQLVILFLVLRQIRAYRRLAGEHQFLVAAKRYPADAAQGEYVGKSVCFGDPDAKNTVYAEIFCKTGDPFFTFRRVGLPDDD